MVNSNSTIEQDSQRLGVTIGITVALLLIGLSPKVLSTSLILTGLPVLVPLVIGYYIGKHQLSTARWLKNIPSRRNRWLRIILWPLALLIPIYIQWLVLNHGLDLVPAYPDSAEIPGSRRGSLLNWDRRGPGAWAYKAYFVPEATSFENVRNFYSTALATQGWHERNTEIATVTFDRNDAELIITVECRRYSPTNTFYSSLIPDLTTGVCTSGDGSRGAVSIYLYSHHSPRGY